MIEYYYLEFLAAFFAIIGSIFMSLSGRERHNYLYKSFISYGLSNLIFVFFFIYHGILPLAIQMMFFLSTAIIGILTYSNNKTRDGKYIKIIISPYVFYIGWYISRHGLTDIEWAITFLEVLASSLAIIGSLILTIKDHSKRKYSFLFFIVADSILIYTSYNHQMYGFMSQAIFFILNSIFGFYLIRKKPKEI